MSETLKPVTIPGLDEASRNNDVEEVHKILSGIEPEVPFSAEYHVLKISETTPEEASILEKSQQENSVYGLVRSEGRSEVVPGYGIGVLFDDIQRALDKTGGSVKPANLTLSLWNKRVNPIPTLEDLATWTALRVGNPAIDYRITFALNDAPKTLSLLGFKDSTGKIYTQPRTTKN